MPSPDILGWCTLKNSSGLASAVIVIKPGRCCSVFNALPALCTFQGASSLSERCLLHFRIMLSTTNDLPHRCILASISFFSLFFLSPSNVQRCFHELFHDHCTNKMSTKLPFCMHFLLLLLLLHGDRKKDVSRSRWQRHLLSCCLNPGWAEREDKRRQVAGGFNNFLTIIPFPFSLFSFYWDSICVCLY